MKVQKNDILLIDRFEFAKLAAKRCLGYGSSSIELSGETYVKEVRGDKIMIIDECGVFRTWVDVDDIARIGGKVVGYLNGRNWLTGGLRRVYKQR